eukprot:Gregarina_sp_Poly_1__10950@NODE_861_length_5941_cov_137_911474_g623_i0_p4_GENE_NODE_861_length_5941_cov_137_911474_g623_i0NODE_861_length_5941_cov_137_911474_g623_i0_p4_ORF_typecomplete_len160_score29_68Prefoldin/PF02996_17/1_3e23FlxA/PF14282_6/37FlxA/PF14282_6/0_013Sec20/PF03908_13/0_042Sec20/PF03908_13/2_7e03CCDC92/PF14916_6/0_042CCDC92/PF14916_6/4_7e03CCDC92/PF14916_6/2_4e03PilO/PF04350_13/4_3PilO/PF04350_13/1_9AIP3/PF03915_13/1_6AIP3/PF03915_13/2Phage_HK97_TLTM/PF06120_11/0_18Prefoldin_2/PF0
MTTQAASPQPVKISDLDVQQVADLKQTLDEELKFLQQQHEALLSAKQRFEASRKTMQELHESVGTPSEMLVPMTQSVYQPGRLVTKDRFIVEIGAEYFVERSYDANKKYLDKRVSSIEAKMEQVGKNLVDKKKMSEIVTLNLQTRIAAMQEQIQNERRH